VEHADCGTKKTRRGSGDTKKRSTKQGLQITKYNLNLGIIQDLESSAWDLQKDGVDHGRKS
jgi:hypothetical protein